jgi:hypothetical protein
MTLDRRPDTGQILIGPDRPVEHDGGDLLTRLGRQAQHEAPPMRNPATPTESPLIVGCASR